MKISPRSFVYACLLTTAVSIPAFAQDQVPPVVALILKNWEQEMRLKPAYESVETDAAGTVTITNLTASFPAASDGPSPQAKMTIGEIELEEISDEGDGLYEIGGVTFSGVKVEGTGADGAPFAIDMPEATVEDWNVKDAGDAPTPQDAFRSAMNVATKMSTSKITVTAGGQTFTVDGYEQTWDGDPATGAGTFAAKLSKVTIPEQAIAPADPMGTMKQLGYSGLTFDIVADGKLDVQQDSIGFDFNFAYVGKDMGSLKFSVAASDIPMAVFGELQKSQATGQEPDFTALMPQLQNVTFHKFSLRFEDDSITKKLMPLAAAMQGMDEATMVANAGAMLQLGLTQLNNPDFTSQVVGAVNSFLKDPKSLTVNVDPASPVKVMDLMTMNPSDPGAAITRLGVSVKAND